MEIISKELFSEVLSEKVRRVLVIGNTVSYSLHKYDDKHSPEAECWAKLVFTINIYELAHKCKEWAFEQGYYLNTDIGHNKASCGIVERHRFNKDIDVRHNSVCELVYTGTEPKAIFEACQWVYNKLQKESICKEGK